MVARVFPVPDMLVDLGLCEPLGEVETKHKVIQAEPGISTVGIPKIIPERINALVWM